ncbi:hypothetical protein, partial [Streptomyces sp. SID3212]|uniref:hypothetical protein n=1 Tax=Streptomyces sp. SID3212 TaxID=2690259 RepID=UPI0013CBC27E
PADPAEADLARAREALAKLDVGTAAAAGLRAELQYAEYLRTGDRLALSETVRRLGPHAATARDYTALVDLANRLRPPLAWRWRGRERGLGQGRALGLGRGLGRERRDGAVNGNGPRVSERQPGR